MKKNPIRIVKKNSLGVSDNEVVSNNGRESSKSVAHKISGNVLNWIDELRERKTIEAIQSFSLLAKVTR